MKTDRFQRHSLIDWFSQEDVHNYKVGVIGCGAIGNEVIKNLILLGVRRIDLYDLDRIEIHNLTRSVLFRESDVGRLKCEVAADRARDLDPQAEPRHFSGDFWDCLSLSDASTYDVIFCCVDNYEARLRLNVMAQIAKANLINTAIDSRHAVIEVFPFATSTEASCYECNLPDSAYASIQKRYSCGWLKKRAYFEKKIPTTIVTSSLAGSLAVASGLNLLRASNETDSVRIFVDTFSGRSTRTKLPRKENCPFCEIRQRQIRITKVKSFSFLTEMHWADSNHELEVVSSDPILVSHYCRNCDPNGEDQVVPCARASDFDSTLTLCGKCSEDAIAVDIRDQFLLKELVDRFGEKGIPAKYLHIRTRHENIFFEMEKDDERSQCGIKNG